MKTGRTLVELATELQRQAGSKKDYLADTRKLRFAAGDAAEGGGAGTVVLEGVNGPMRLKATAHAQVAGALSIPKVYYDRLLASEPDLLAANVNRWLEKQPARKLVRTLDGEVRAFLSDGYRPLDNVELAEAVIPALHKLEAQVVSAEVTESRFYLKAVTPKVSEVVGKVRPHQAGDSIGMIDDVIQAGVVVSNSEIGYGAMQVAAMTHRLVCLNGAIHEAAVRKAHIGRDANGFSALDDAREYFRSETRAAADKAFFLQVQDAVGAMFDAAKFAQRIDSYRAAADRKIVKDVAEVVEVTAKKLLLNDAERVSVLDHLIRGGDLSQFGLANAVTRASADVESYDRATELEAAGGGIFLLPAHEWQRLAV